MNTTIATPPSHVHVADLDAPIDLINTLELTDGQPREDLPTAADAVAFLAQRGLAHDYALERQADLDGDAWLSRVRAVRAALRELWDSQVEARAPRPDALATLNAVLDRGPHPELRSTATGTEVAHRHQDDDPTGEALARVAIPLVEAIASGDTDRFRICANDGCRWVFEDGSRAGRRRWCDMATCGNQAKARRFRSRHRHGSSEMDGPEALPAGPDAVPAGPEGLGD